MALVNQLASLGYPLPVSDISLNNLQKNDDQNLPHIEPYLNLLASHHNAYIVPGKNGRTEAIVEIEPEPNSVVANDRIGDATSDPDRQFLGIDSTTTMGAVTLIAFLNLLGYIQTVLGSSAGKRKRRSVDDVTEDFPGSGSRQIPISPIPTLMGEVFRGLGIWAEHEEEMDELEEKKIHPVDNKLAESRMDDNLFTTPQRGTWRSFFSYLGQRFKLASNVMNFLNDPSPARIRRSLETATERALRSKRFTSAMNVWYEELAGRNFEDNGQRIQSEDSPDIFSSLMLKIGRQILGR